MINLNELEGNVYSADNEDAIIEYLLGTLEHKSNLAIEFGAHNGLFFSNTAALWQNQGYEALLIESDLSLYQQLVNNTAHNSKVVTRNAYVKNIDDFTTRTADIISIDVDGSDFQIFATMQTPHQIVVVEYNPTVPPHVSMVNVEGTMFGSSAKSLVNLATTKNYTLVGCTKTNLIFLYGQHHDIYETRLEVLFDNSSLNYVCTSYTGDWQAIGPWGYGFGRPCDLRLLGGELDTSHVMDSDTKQYYRQWLTIEGENK